MLVANYRWYITSTGWSWAYDHGQAQRTPDRLRHAKALGQNLTACGMNCNTWTKFWHPPYIPGQIGHSCAECDAVVSGSDHHQPVQHPSMSSTTSRRERR